VPVVWQRRAEGLGAGEVAAGARPGWTGAAVSAPVAVHRLRGDACVVAGERATAPRRYGGGDRVSVGCESAVWLRVSLEPPGFAPTGRRWELDGGDFYEYRDGRVCKVRSPYDVLSASRQLGLLPAAGGRAERAFAIASASLPECSRQSGSDGTVRDMIDSGSSSCP